MVKPLAKIAVNVRHVIGETPANRLVQCSRIKQFPVEVAVADEGRH